MVEANLGKLADATKTAIVVPVAEVEAVVGPYRRVLDHTASWPVPAHVTVLHPFAAPARITDGMLEDVRTCLAEVPAFTCTFSKVAWFGQDVMWLAPEPDTPFRRLTDIVWRQFPEFPPYRGTHPEPTPHLTVGSTRLADLAGMQRAAGDLRAKLPIDARIDRVRLIAGTEAPGSWRNVAEFALPPTAATTART
ncbi:2'-5' RNA ligase family protein [Streptomyces sp. NPDC058268]|uniref:2'-5' RNA ligase family protein n=1 Tax=Streptomyces sp. NPDC058268 TaxID=3346413 RepID=UPI0036E6E81A